MNLDVMLAHAINSHAINSHAIMAAESAGDRLKADEKRALRLE
ncbi:hypothetical protein [Sandarakinorhabdus sp. DWP1-3-1]